MDQIDQIWFSGHYNYRTTHELKRGLALLGMGVGTALLGVWLIVSASRDNEFNWRLIGVTVNVLAVVFSAIGIASLIAFLGRRVDHLVLSTTGVSYGREHWEWKTIKGIQFVLANTSCKVPHIKLSIRKQSGSSSASRSLTVNKHLTSYDEMKLVAATRQFFNDSHLDIDIMCSSSNPSDDRRQYTEHPELSVGHFYRDCRECGGKPIVHILALDQREPVLEFFLCENHASLANEQFGIHCQRTGVEIDVDSSRSDKGEIRFDIEALVARTDGSCRLYLRELAGTRSFQLELGYVEATALYWALKGELAARPLTHQVLATAIDALGGTLQYVLIDRFSDDRSFVYAYLQIVQDGRQLSLDVRPSDAVNLAVVCNVPIFVSESAI